MAALFQVRAKSWSTLQVITLLLSYSIVLGLILTYVTGGLNSGSRLSILPELEQASNELKSHISSAIEQQGPSSNLISASEHAQVNTDLVVFVYYENEFAIPNLEFFIAHALHDKADFLFVINGHEVSVEIPNRPNIKVVRRDNTCYDLGTYREVLEADDSYLLHKYTRFILLNASIRGPFFPAWARTLKNACWTSVFFSYLTDRNKLVGLSANCGEGWQFRHIQSMLIAVDRIGYDLIRPSLSCWSNLNDAVYNGEIPMTNRVLEAGYEADVIFNARYERTFENASEYFSSCGGLGGNWEPSKYWGFDVNPLDTLFVKNIRTRWPEMDKVPVYEPAGQLIFETFSRWMDDSQFSSYDQC